MSLHPRLLCLLVLMGVYGAFGQPTPDALGWVEVVLGILLILAVGLSGVREALFFAKGEALWIGFARVLLLFGLSVPLLGGVIAGHSLHAVLRDIVPFFFMMLPLFMVQFFREYPENFRFVVYGAVFVGLAFAVRAGLGSDPLLYLANMPSVLMAAILCAGMGVNVFIQRFTWRSVWLAIVLFALAGMALWPLIETQQRASVGVFVLAVVLVFAHSFWFHPRRTLVLLVPLAFVLAAYGAEIAGVWDVMARKQDLVGLNSRIQEWQAVWDEVSAHPLSLLFGQGWGASFASPAVADIQVHYTHGLLSSMLLKAGLIGFILSGFYIYALLRDLVALGLQNPGIVLAVLLPILIDVFLYASFKSLDFGLVLMLIPAFLYFQQDKASRKIEKT